MSGLLSRFLIFVRLSIRNALRQRRRSLITCFAIGVGMLSANFLTVFTTGAGRQLVTDAVYSLTGHLQVHHPRYQIDPVPEHHITPSALRYEAVVRAFPRAKLIERVRLPVVVSSERESRGVTLVGIDPSAERGISFIGDLDTIETALANQDGKGIVVGRALLEKLETGLGKRIVLIGQKIGEGTSERGFQIRGVFDSEIEATELEYVFVLRSAAAQFFGIPSAVTELSITLEDSEQVDEAVHQLATIFPDQKVQSWRELKPLVNAITVVQSKIRLFWAVLVGVVLAFSLLNSMFMAIHERLPELGLYGALGVAPSGIVWIVVLESSMLLITGAAIGDLLTWGLMKLLGGRVDLSMFARGTQEFGIRSVVELDAAWSELWPIHAIVLGVGLLWSAYPALRASRTPPAVAMQ